MWATLMLNPMMTWCRVSFLCVPPCAIYMDLIDVILLCMTPVIECHFP